jgi:hypothetical protein
VVGIDEDTALIWERDTWSVAGARQVWLLRAEGRTAYDVGATLPLPPLPEHA